MFEHSFPYKVLPHSYELVYRPIYIMSAIRTESKNNLAMILGGHHQHGIPTYVYDLVDYGSWQIYP